MSTHWRHTRTRRFTMAIATVKNQERIIANQKKILVQQDHFARIITKNQEKIMRNQGAIIKNQKKIMAAEARIAHSRSR
jgi:hypothetical protein